VRRARSSPPVAKINLGRDALHNFKAVFGFRNAGADKDGGVNGGPFLFMMKPSISLSRPGAKSWPFVLKRAHLRSPIASKTSALAVEPQSEHGKATKPGSLSDGAISATRSIARAHRWYRA
jgi:hypothetical protein